MSFLCVGVWVKSSASAVCIITLKALTRAGEAGFSIYIFFFFLMERSISPTSVTMMEQLLRHLDRKWSSVPPTDPLVIPSSL